MRQRAMRLRDVTHRKGTQEEPYRFGSSSFAAFNRDGLEINKDQLEDMEESGIDVLGIKVLRVRESTFTGGGFTHSVTHVKLDVGDRFGGQRLKLSPDCFGDAQTNGGRDPKYYGDR